MIRLIALIAGVLPLHAMGFLLHITAPTMRENGVELAIEELSHYELFYNGEYWQTLEPQAIEVEVTQDGEYMIRAVDIEGLVSQFSDTVVVLNALRSPPRKPGLGKKKGHN